MSCWRRRVPPCPKRQFVVLRLPPHFRGEYAAAAISTRSSGVSGLSRTRTPPDRRPHRRKRGGSLTADVPGSVLYARNAAPSAEVQLASAATKAGMAG